VLAIGGSLMELMLQLDVWLFRFDREVQVLRMGPGERELKYMRLLGRRSREDAEEAHFTVFGHQAHLTSGLAREMLIVESGDQLRHRVIVSAREVRREAKTLCLCTRR
jgi:hypothetical protein